MEQAEIEKLIGELEVGVDRLRSLYEQYFMGIEKLEPGVPRKDVERRIQVLRKVQLRNTAMRFRFQMVLQRFNTYQTHWQRICREIENGTYKRHLIRAQRRFGTSSPPGPRSVPPPPVRPEAGAPLPKELAAQLAELDEDFAPASLSVDVSLDDPASVRRPPGRPSVPPLPPLIATTGRVMPGSPAAPPKANAVPGPVWRKLGASGSGSAASPAAPAARPPSIGAAPPVRLPSAPARQLPPPAATSKLPPSTVAPAQPPKASPPAGGTDLPEERMRQIYAQYVDTKRKQNESTAAITYQAVAKSLKESGEKLRQKHGKSVDFEVAVKDGKTVLKPVVKG